MVCSGGLSTEIHRVMIIYNSELGYTYIYIYTLCIYIYIMYVYRLYSYITMQQMFYDFVEGIVTFDSCLHLQTNS